MKPAAEGSAVVGRAQVAGCAAAATGQVVPERAIEKEYRLPCFNFAQQVAYGNARLRNEAAALSKAT